MHDFQFYVPADQFAKANQIVDHHAVLIGDELAHCCRVLRKKAGDSIRLFDGNGHHYDAKILSVEKNRRIVRLSKGISWSARYFLKFRSVSVW